MNDNIKTHLKCIKKILYCYILGIVLSWAALPVLLIVFARVTTINSPQAVYTTLTTLVFSCVLYISMHDFGNDDRKPYRWARYKAKGFVCGFIAAIIIILIEAVIITLANRYIIVQHPQFLISSLNAYVTQIIYMPFFWFYSLIDKSVAIIPAVTYLSSLFIAPFLSIVSGFGYFMGFMDIRIIKNPKKINLLQRLVYKDRTKKK